MKLYPIGDTHIGHPSFREQDFKKTLAKIDKEKDSYIPLDEKLGINKKHTPACNYFSSFHTGKGPYQESLDHFHEIFRPNGIDYISLSKAENMDRELGEKINIIKELRLVICGWCFGIALWVAPKNDPEGLMIIESVRQWASKSATYLTNQFRRTAKKRRS